MLPVLALILVPGFPIYRPYRLCVTFMDGVTVFFFLLNRTGARDSENASLTLGDLASLFTQDEERDEEQCMTGSFGFHEETDELSPG